ncbi:hypothetical protein NFI96_027155 [Prochilodus magdalenae]|nr:hypothetical protein NFI96_027155 [Prochilodus magdalenae]
MTTVTFGENFTTLFDTTRDRIFTEIHRMVSRSLSDLLPPEMKNVMSTKPTSALTSIILDDSLKQVKSTVIEIHDRGYHQAMNTISMVYARNLLFATVNKMEDFLQMCTLTDWLRTSQESPLSVNEVLDPIMPLVTVKAVRAVFQAMLTTCTEGSSKELKKFGSATPLYNFFEDVAEDITSQIPSSATTPRQYSGGTFFSGIQRQLFTSLTQTDTVETETQIRPRCQRA